MRLALVVAVAACGRVGFATTAPDTGAEHSGARLKVVWNQFEDGARQPASLFDSQRAEACEIEPLADGHVFCLPEPAVSASFADADCTQPLAVWDGQCTQPRYAIDRTACGDTRGAYPIAGASAVTAVYDRSIGSCTGPSSEPAGTTFDLGGALAAGELAEVTLATAAATGRLAAQSYTSGDGFAIQAQPYDRDLAASCTPLQSAGGSSCPPSNVAFTAFTLDAQCTQSLAIAPSACGPPAFASYTALGQCGNSYATVGALLMPQPTMLYTESAGSCAATSMLPAGFAYFSLGVAISVATLARAPVPDPSHRIWPVEFTADGFRYRDAQLYDSALGVECAVGVAADGSLRCIPSGAYITHLFSDPGCSVPLDVAIDVPPLNCPTPMPAFAVAIDSTTCGGTTRSFRVGAPFGGALFGGSPAACSAETALGPVFSVAEMSPSELAAATQVMDP